ncbi:hypothetical protein HMPREF9072_01839 [Capnocytophaga sp. oral taxon 324 str. F0483]|nr:hypothetical protein HMPREF9072_01839 [Capnocytophaga sp. oral taxon 324 str. F0483]
MVKNTLFFHLLYTDNWKFLHKNFYHLIYIMYSISNSSSFNVYPIYIVQCLSNESYTLLKFLFTRRATTFGKVENHSPIFFESYP